MTVIYLIVWSASIQSIYLICLSVVVHSARKPYHTTTVLSSFNDKAYKALLTPTHHLKPSFDCRFC